MNPNEKCSICLSELENNPNEIMKTKCDHYFHTDCWNQYENHCSGVLKCPMCRTELDDLGNTDDDYYQSDEYQNSDLNMNGPPPYTPTRIFILPNGSRVSVTNGIVTPM